MLVYLFVITCIIKKGLMLSEGQEPMCLSRFDFDYKVLSKLVFLETAISELRQTQATLLEETKNFKDLSTELSTQKTAMVALNETLTGALIWFEKNCDNYEHVLVFNYSKLLGRLKRRCFVFGRIILCKQCFV